MSASTKLPAAGPLDRAKLGFDAEMDRVMQALADHREAIADYETLCIRQLAARDAMAAFVFEAACTLAELQAGTGVTILDLMRPRPETVQ